MIHTDTLPHRLTLLCTVPSLAQMYAACTDASVAYRSPVGKWQRLHSPVVWSSVTSRLLASHTLARLPRILAQQDNRHFMYGVCAHWFVAVAAGLFSPQSHQAQFGPGANYQVY